MKALRIYSLLAGLFLLLYLGFAHAQDITILGSIPLDTGIDSVALTPNADIAYGINSEEKTLYIFDLKNYSVKKTINLDRKPISIAVNPSTNIAYITARDDKNDGLLYTADSEGEISAIDIQRDPQGIAIDQIRNEALIALEKDKQLLVLSLDTFDAEQTIELPHRPRTVSLDTDSNRAVIVAGKAEGEGKQNIILVVDLSTGDILLEITLKEEIESLAVAVSKKEINLVDINTGKILSTIKMNGAEGTDINQSIHMAIVTSDEGFMLLDLNSFSAVSYVLESAFKTVAIDKYRNTALFGGEDKVIVIQLSNPIPEITNLIPKSARAGVRSDVNSGYQAIYAASFSL